MSIDTHAHVFLRTGAMVANRRYTPDYDATPDAYLEMLNANGCSHGVLVQPSFLGTDNSYLLSVLTRYPERLRGVVVVAPDSPLPELERLRDLRVVGVRLNLIGQPDPEFGAPEWRRHFDHLATLGWQAELHVEAARLKQLLPSLIDADIPVVVDHFGRPDPALGVQDPGFRFLLDAAGKGRIFVKLSGAYRLGPSGEGVAHEAASLLLQSFGPEHLMWGSDWPHTQFETTADPRRARSALDNWVPDPSERETILWSTPAGLFGFAGN